MRAIVVHGGAGKWREPFRPAALRGVARAADAGWGVLAAGGHAIDAVTIAVVALEDDPAFNAGTGSVLNEAGEAEMDASVMAGDTLAAGGVSGVTRVRNPVLVARRVMEATDCVLLAGPQATAFAREQGFGDYDPVTAAARQAWAAARSAPRATPAEDGAGTVGAVALDAAGRLAAATSTGGRELKRAGRVGDSPVPGAGNVATARAAVSATGWGELMLRFGTARAIAERIDRGVGAQRAVEEILEAMRVRFAVPIGAIALDSRGDVAIAHGTPAMPHAWRRLGDAKVQARLSRERDGAATGR
jgi:beta-aspartyl-peptidase (threonine type)